MLLTNAYDRISVGGFGGISLALTLDCGQAFRWTPCPDGSWHGVVRSSEVYIRQDGDTLIFSGISQDSFDNIFRPYFCLDSDYESILGQLSEDKAMREAVKKYGTVRILRQEPWEALCSFIISACNNIPRIKGIVGRLCESFGEPCGDSFSFPQPEILASLSEKELDTLRAGYRVPYILDAARRVASGETDLNRLEALPVDEARSELMKIKGVGRKVADCTLLFGMGRLDVFPVDRHIRRITAELYPDGLPSCFSPYEGIAQQYMFCAARGI